MKIMNILNKNTTAFSGRDDTQPRCQQKGRGIIFLSLVIISWSLVIIFRSLVIIFRTFVIFSTNSPFLKPMTQTL